LNAAAACLCKGASRFDSPLDQRQSADRRNVGVSSGVTRGEKIDLKMSTVPTVAGRGQTRANGGGDSHLSWSTPRMPLATPSRTTAHGKLTIENRKRLTTRSYSRTMPYRGVGTMSISVSDPAPAVALCRRHAFDPFSSPPRIRQGTGSRAEPVYFFGKHRRSVKILRDPGEVNDDQDLSAARGCLSSS